MSELAELIVKRFRGRPDVKAVQTQVGFEPAAQAATAADIDRFHLSGQRCLGVYTTTPENNCYFAAVDFDDHPKEPDPEWKKKAESFYLALAGDGLHPLMEIGQSGSGCHVWIFFASPCPAWVPRAWFRAVAESINCAINEIYPKQDSLSATKKEIGNLIRFPLWNKSHFVDVENGWAAADPSEVLKSIVCTDAEELRILAMELGLGELKPEVATAMTEISVGASDSTELSPRVKKLIGKEWSYLGRRWRGDSHGLKDASKSGLSMSIAVELVRQYVPTPEIAAAIRHWMTMNGGESKADRDDWVARTVAKAYDFIITREEKKSVDSATFQTASHRYLDLVEAGSEIFIGSGIPAIDLAVDGVGAGEVCVIAARPNHGKSAIALQWLDHASGAGIPGLIISEEMVLQQIGKRRLMSITNLPQEHWGADTVKQLRCEVDQYHEPRAKVFVVENCNSVDRAEEVIEQFVSVHGVGIVALDYLQLLTTRAASRYEVVTEVSRRIAQVTKRLGIRTLLVSQLNRGVESRTDNEPKMSDLRESGGIEQDADLIIFGQYPCKFDPSVSQNAYRMYFAKRRNGPIRQTKAELYFDPNRQTFSRDGGY
jgi:replicative DNA helicase